MQDTTKTQASTSSQPSNSSQNFGASSPDFYLRELKGMAQENLARGWVTSYSHRDDLAFGTKQVEWVQMAGRNHETPLDYAGFALFTGSRRIRGHRTIFDLVRAVPTDWLVVVGEQEGVDTAVARLAKAMGKDALIFHAHWAKLKAAAGPRRNRRMVEHLVRGKALGKGARCVALHYESGFGQGTQQCATLAQGSAIPTDRLLLDMEHPSGAWVKNATPKDYQPCTTT